MGANAALGVGGNAGAEKRKPNPLAFAAGVVTGVEVGIDGATFVWAFIAKAPHPTSGFTQDGHGACVEPCTRGGRQR